MSGTEPELSATWIRGLDMLTRLLMTVGLRLSPGLVAGATFVVNSTLAAVEVTPGNGVCATAGGVCTFRAAGQEANALAGTHVITLSSGTYTLTIAGRDESNGATGDLNIASNQNITINGVGAATTIVDANGIDRVFRIGFGNLTLTDTTITKNVNPGIGGSGAGGGVYIGSGTATITRSTISGNSGQSGGGIFVAGDAGLGPSTVTVTDSTITQNVVSTTSGGGGWYT